MITHDIPDNSVVAGVPARVIGSFDNYVEKRLKMEKYPEVLKTKSQIVTDELANLLWENFNKKHA